jgi:C-terminal processing protease CtpA/Prc
MRKYLLILSIGLLLAGVTLPAVALGVDPGGDTTRIRRLAGLCRAWGAIKYFHPYLAYKDIDWDDAALGTIKLVNEADDASGYRTAIKHLLSRLQDPNTCVFDDSAAVPPRRVIAQGTPQPYIEYTPDGIAVVVMNDYRQVVNDRGGSERLRYLFGETLRSKGVIIDVRRLDAGGVQTGHDEIDKRYGDLVLRTFPVMLTENIAVPSRRYRMHTGYAPDDRCNPAGFFSAWMYTHGVPILAQNSDGDQVPIIFVTNAGSELLQPLFGALQASGRAAIVHEGYFDRETGITTYRMTLPDSIRIDIRTDELVRPDGSVGIHPDWVIPFEPDSTLLASPGIRTAIDAMQGKWVIPRPAPEATSPATAIRPEESFSDKIPPPLEYRLLALFRLWNILYYFHPRDVCPEQSWDSLLQASIPAFEAATEPIAYAGAVCRFLEAMHDPQAYVDNWPLLRQYFGQFFPPFAARILDSRLVVTEVFYVPGKKAASLRTGDIIVAVDGQGVGQLLAGMAIREVMPPMSRPLVILTRLGLSGPRGSEVKLTVADQSGKIRDITVDRLVESPIESPDLPDATTFDDGIGYIDLRRLPPAHVDSVMEAMRNVPGLILDLRGDSAAAASAILEYLTDSEVPFACDQIVERHGPDPTEIIDRSRWRTILPRDGWKYHGAVAVLVNEDVAGQAEYAGLGFAALPQVVLVGAPTAGAVGDMTTTILPGGIIVGFAGVSVRTPAGEMVQGRGITPDVGVQPTLDGIRAGRDEILDAAHRYLLENPVKR